MVSAVFISKILGIILIVPMQNLIGEYALGIYGIVYPLYTIMLTLSTAGFPLALSKTISTLTAKGKYKEANGTFSIVGRSLFLFGFFAFFIMWFGGPWYISLVAPGQKLLHDAIPAVRTLAPALLLLPLMSAQRGYLQGNLRLEPSAASQVIEQIVRVFVVLAGLMIGLSMGLTAGPMAAIATFGATAGAIGGFLLLLASVKKLRRETLRKSRFEGTPTLKTLPVLQSLLAYSLPIVLGTLVLPLSQSIDVFTVPRELLFSGVNTVTATAEFGRYTQEALRLIQLPLSFATAIGASILPAISSALAKGNYEQARQRLTRSLRMTAYIMIPAAVALGTFAAPIDVTLFKSAQGAQLISLAAVMSIFSGLELVTTYILQGHDRFYQPVFHMVMGLIIKLIGNLLLVPMLGIGGAAIAGIIGYAVSSWMNMTSIRKVTMTDVSFPKVAWRSLLSSLVLGVWLYALDRLYLLWGITFHASSSRMTALLAVVIGLAIGAPLYIMASLWFKATDREELSSLPMVGRLIARWI